MYHECSQWLHQGYRIKRGVKTFRHAVSLDERRAKFKHHLWHVHSVGGQPPRSPREPESTKTAEPRFLSPIAQSASPTVQSVSPVAALRPTSKLRESNLKEVDFTITEATPPTIYESTPDTEIDRSSQVLWAGGQVDRLSPTGAHEQNMGMSLKKESPKRLDALGADQANTSLHLTKSDASLASKVTLERDAASLEVNRENSLLGRIRSRLWVDRGPRARSTDSSGAFEYEAAQCRIDKGRKEWETDVLEVWFAGCHGDVGGGSVKDTDEHQLSNISLRWMIRQIISSQCGIKFDAAALKAMHISPATVSFGMKPPNSHYSSPSDVKLVDTAQKQEMGDALAKPHDNLRKLAWWPLEFVPLFHTSIDEKGDKHIKIRRPNLFRGRRPHVSNGKIKVHRTVQYRMDNSDLPRYKYKARIAEEDIEWVD
ncbi:unnamed protein product [Rhizoctonia solani]|uniref:T6SS Phospholipase effector Tle1-like catalytic domain-containing protein n=1 Tax=Rhizoctonia solani TaxID=456999 RepID=A0A8H3DBV6_9AGAM|nr:unnamed protein product [Rhizoctonia solani]